ncbi:MAG: glycosyltransferase family 4 protein [Candidatus Bathyarchaeota archaeon]|nr:glycosyltransferase family 4 protein [Candidatus Bathyarchaeota archaeon]
MRYAQDKRLLERGHKVFVVSCKTFGTPFFEEIGGIEVYRVPAFALPVLEYPLPNLLMLYFWIIRIARMKKVDLILVTDSAYLTSLMTIFIKRVLKQPIILIVQGFPGLSWFYGNFLADFFARIFTFTVGRRALKVVDKVILAATRQRVDAVRLGASIDKIEVIPRGVDTRLFYPNREQREMFRDELGLKHDDVVALFAGRLVPVKGITHFISVAKILAEKSDRWKFLVAGDGVLRATCEKETGQYRLRIKFIGWRDDMPRVMNAADIFVLSSISEGCPNAVLEACACGKLVVATNVGAANDIILNGETGLLVEPGDVNALQDALERVLSNLQNTKMGEKALQRVRKYFAWDAIISKCEKVYCETLRGGDAERSR